MTKSAPIPKAKPSPKMPPAAEDVEQEALDRQEQNREFEDVTTDALEQQADRESDAELAD